MNRLGDDILELCPTMKDREDEEEIQQNFCFVLAEELEKDGIISYHAKRLLSLDEYVLPLFSAADSTACLMLHTVRQEHGVKVKERLTEPPDDKTEPTTAKADALSEVVVSGEERMMDGEREREGVMWRQQATVIIYDGRDGYTEEAADFEEDEEMSTMETDYPSTDSPSKILKSMVSTIIHKITFLHNYKTLMHGYIHE